MIRALLLVGVTLIALLVAACGDDDGAEDPSTPTAIEPAAGPTEPEDDTTAAPSGDRTGIAAVDDAIAALEDNDTGAIISSLQLAQVECASTPVPLYAIPPCEGAPDGSLVDAFPMAQCEGDYLLPDEAEEGIRLLLEERPEHELYAVYGVADSVFEQGFFGRAGPQYAIVLASDIEGSAWGWAVLVNESGITGISSGCAQSPDEYVTFWELTDPVLAPR